MRPLLYFLILLSLIPAALLGFQRIGYEQGYKTLALVIDYDDLDEQSTRSGLELDTLLERYRAVGLSGVAITEDIVVKRSKRRELLYQSGSSLLQDYPDNTQINPNWHYYRELVPGSVSSLTGRFFFRTTQIEVGGLRWYGWPVSLGGASVGPDLPEIERLKAQGLTVVYRPADDVSVRDPAADLPPVDYLAFYGTTVPGADTPERLATVKSRLGNRTLAIIEGSEQEGLDTLLEGQPAVRLFAINPAWQARLEPGELADKYVLAARERMHRLLYFRPYPNSVEKTEALLRDTTAGLARAGLRVGNPGPIEYQPTPVLRWLSVLGPLAGLLLLVSLYPLRWLGLSVGALTLLGCLVIGGLGQPLSGLALLAGVTYPALGLALRRRHPLDWLTATLWTLVGVAFLSALGTTLPGMLGLEPFRGVSLVLFLPILLFLGALVPNQDIRKTARELYSYPIRLGDILLIGVVLGAAALIFLRRGNATGGGVSEIEARIREGLQDSLIRPRFKELIGHPLAILGLSGGFPPYVAILLLLGGVFGQASLMNTFGHYHTPLWISLQRAINGVILGGLIGFVAIPLVLWAVRWFSQHHSSASAPAVKFDNGGRQWRGGD